MRNRHHHHTKEKEDEEEHEDNNESTTPVGVYARTKQLAHDGQGRASNTPLVADEFGDTPIFKASIR